MKALFSWLAAALGDGENPSTMRIVMTYGTTLILTIWAALCLHARSLLPFDQSVIEVLGLLLLGKVAQAHIESKTPPPAP